MYTAKIKDVPEFEKGLVAVKLVTEKTAACGVFFARIFKKNSVARFQRMAAFHEDALAVYTDDLSQVHAVVI